MMLDISESVKTYLVHVFRPHARSHGFHIVVVIKPQFCRSTTSYSKIRIKNLLQ
jgi:hypothetical protein